MFQLLICLFQQQFEVNIDSNTNSDNPIEVAEAVSATISKLGPAQSKEQHKKC